MNYAHHGFDNVAPAVSPNMPAPVAAPAFDYGCGYPAVAPYSYGCAPVAGYGGTGTFVLVVVLFILLIIIGCSCGTW